jgi:hypothetical protein
MSASEIQILDDVSVPMDYTDSRNISSDGSDLEVMVYIKSRVVAN